jgi:hypothetical protein
MDDALHIIITITVYFDRCGDQAGPDRLVVGQQLGFIVLYLAIALQGIDKLFPSCGGIEKIRSVVYPGILQQRSREYLLLHN